MNKIILLAEHFFYSTVLLVFMALWGCGSDVTDYEHIVFCEDIGCPDLSSYKETDDTFYIYQGNEFVVPLGHRTFMISALGAKKMTDISLRNKRLLISRNGLSKYGPQDKTLPRTSTPEDMLTAPFDFFHFCMPDRETLNIQKSVHTYTDLTCQHVDSLSYVVSFTPVWAFEDGLESSKAFAPFKRAFLRYEQTGQHFPMLRASEEYDNGPRTDISVNDERVFRQVFSDDGDLVVMFTCTPILGAKSEIARKKSCAGFAWLRSKNIMIKIRLPGAQSQVGYQDLWREPVMKAFELFESWKVVSGEVEL